MPRVNLIEEFIGFPTASTALTKTYDYAPKHPGPIMGYNLIIEAQSTTTTTATYTFDLYALTKSGLTQRINSVTTALDRATYAQTASTANLIVTKFSAPSQGTATGTTYQPAVFGVPVTPYGFRLIVTTTTGATGVSSSAPPGYTIHGDLSFYVERVTA